MTEKSDVICEALRAELLSKGDQVPIYCEILRSRRQDATGQYLIVACDVMKEELDLHRLAALSRNILGVCARRDMLDGLIGMEILFRTISAGVAKRIMRVTVEAESVAISQTISEVQLREANPWPGVHTLVYVKDVLRGVA